MKFNKGGINEFYRVSGRHLRRAQNELRSMSFIGGIGLGIVFNYHSKLLSELISEGELGVQGSGRSMVDLISMMTIICGLNEISKRILKEGAHAQI